MKILITGPQGSGKTTQAKILSQKLNLCFVGAGDLVRQLAKEDNQRAKDIKEKLEHGKVVDNKLIFELIKKRLAQKDCEGGFVSDSYPRTFAQAAVFDPEFDKVFYLNISDEEAKKRLLLRGRSDDTPEAIDNRLRWFHSQTEPLIQKYQKAGKVIIIDGSQSIDKVAEEISRHLELA